jgi:hypothetical protein
LDVSSNLCFRNPTCREDVSSNLCFRNPTCREYDGKMVVQVQKTGNVFSFELSPDAIRDLKLKDGSALDVRLPEADAAPAIRYASVDEMMHVHRQLEPRHARAYEELAK